MAFSRVQAGSSNEQGRRCPGLVLQAASSLQVHLCEAALCSGTITIGKGVEQRGGPVGKLWHPAGASRHPAHRLQPNTDLSEAAGPALGALQMERAGMCKRCCFMPSPAGDGMPQLWWGQWRSEDASVLGSLGIPSLREAVRAQGNRLKR